jgi:predicted glycoside hydrolase/deacetylase ChbG (UPF0249 family)
MRTFTLCADDYSQSPPINRAILKLLEMERLDAVSCLTLSPTWREDAHTLRGIGSGSAGLHFNLTLPFGQQARKVSAILATALLGKIDPKAVHKAFQTQWNAFIDAMGHLPSFVDGHQHVHSFPVIRDVIVDFVAQAHPCCKIRTLQPPPGLKHGPFKQRLLEHVSRPLTSLLTNAGLATNRHFAGFRSYRNGEGFRRVFVRWINACGDPPLIMCHPGMSSENLSDPIRISRYEEFRYLSSRDFIFDCANGSRQFDGLFRTGNHQRAIPPR